MLIPITTKILHILARSRCNFSQNFSQSRAVVYKLSCSQTNKQTNK